MAFIEIVLLTFYFVLLVLLLLFLCSAPSLFNVKRKAQVKGQPSDVSFFRT